MHKNKIAICSKKKKKSFARLEMFTIGILMQNNFMELYSLVLFY